MGPRFKQNPLLCAGCSALSFFKNDAAIKESAIKSNKGKTEQSDAAGNGKLISIGCEKYISFCRIWALRRITEEKSGKSKQVQALTTKISACRGRWSFWRRCTDSFY
jgi:hypothetical protein